jgi:hypothetical protein
MRPQDHLLPQVDGPNVEEGVSLENRNLGSAASEDVVVVVECDGVDLGVGADVTGAEVGGADDPDLELGSVHDPGGVVALETGLTASPPRVLVFVID